MPTATDSKKSEKIKVSDSAMAARAFAHGHVEEPKAKKGKDTPAEFNDPETHISMRNFTPSQREALEASKALSDEGKDVDTQEVARLKRRVRWAGSFRLIALKDQKIGTDKGTILVKQGDDVTEHLADFPYLRSLIDSNFVGLQDESGKVSNDETLLKVAHGPDHDENIRLAGLRSNRDQDNTIGGKGKRRLKKRASLLGKDVISGEAMASDDEDDDATESDEQTSEAFNPETPGAYTVEEIVAHLSDHPEDADTIYEFETHEGKAGVIPEGKARAGVLEAVEHVQTAGGDEGDSTDSTDDSTKGAEDSTEPPAEEVKPAKAKKSTKGSKSKGSKTKKG